MSGQEILHALKEAGVVTDQPPDTVLKVIEDVFQIEGRGVMLCGRVGPAWDQLKAGLRIKVVTPGAEDRLFWVKACERFNNSNKSGQNAAILLRDHFRKEVVLKYVKPMESVVFLVEGEQ